MKKQGENLLQKTKPQNQPNQSSSKQLQRQILILATFIKKSPKSIQNHLAPYIIEFRKEYPKHQKLQQLTEVFLHQQIVPQFNQVSQNLMKIYMRLLQLKLIPNMMLKIHQKLIKQTQEFIVEKQKRRANNQILDVNFQKIELMCPHYDIYYRMSKQSKDKTLPYIDFNSQLMKKSNFYSQPRFFVKIQQFTHYRSNQRLKSNVLFLEYEGNLINGRKVYGITKDNNVSIWSIQTYQNQNMEAFELDNNSLNVEDRKQNRLKLQRNHVYNDHLERITSISFSLDQFYFISGSHDRTVKLWCLRTKSCLCTFKGHLKVVWSVCFSESGYYFLSGSGDGMMKLWKTSDPNAKRIYYHKNDIYKVSFAKNPDYVISAGEDCSIKIWNLQTAQAVRQIRLNKAIINFTLGFSGTFIVATQRDGKITILNLRTGELQNNFYFYQDKLSSQQQKGLQQRSKMYRLKIHDICLSQDQKQLACISSKYVIIYDMSLLKNNSKNNIISIFQTNSKETQMSISPKQIIYMGIDNNLTFCNYQHKNVLVVGGNKAL